MTDFDRILVVSAEREREDSRTIEEQEELDRVAEMYRENEYESKRKGEV